MIASIRTSVFFLAALAGLFAANFNPRALHAEDLGDVSDKLDRVERDLRELQYEVYKGSPPANTGGNAGAPVGTGAASGARLNDLEQSLRELRGQVETLAFQLKQMNEQLELSRKETAYRLGALEGGAPASPLPVNAGPAPKPLSNPKPASGFSGGSNQGAQQPGTLGSVPSAAVDDYSSIGPTPRQQYDAAMELLTRAQYSEAQSAFRGFVATNPKDELAGPAQYWVGDIAFTQKDYQGAAKSFADVLKRYSKTAKAPDAMLKLGLSLMELGQKKESCTTFGAIKAKYPNASKTVLDRAARRAAEAKCA